MGFWGRIRWSGVLGAALVLAVGCRKSPQPADVVFWTAEAEADRMAVQEELAREFGQGHPGVSVRVVPVDENVLSEKLAAASAAGELPDVVQLGLTQVVQYAAEGLLDAGAATELIQELGEEGFYPGPLNLCRTPDGSAYAAVPLDAWVQGVWYRKDWFEERGLPPPDSWERILAAAQALHDPGASRFGVVLGAHPRQVYTQQVFEHLALAAGARLFDEQGRYANDPRLVQALGFYRELARYAAPGHTYWREARQYYLTDRAAMIFYSPYIVDDIAGLVADHRPDRPDLARRTGFVAAIRGPGGKPAVYGEVYALGILKGADPAAGEWVAFLLGPGYGRWLAMAPGGKMPVRRAAREAWARQALFRPYGPGVPGALASGLENLGRWGFLGGGRERIGALYASKRVPEAIGLLLDEGEAPERVAAWLGARIRELPGNR